MKKLVSLLLALILGICTLGAFAESAVPAPTFDLDILSYQTTFNMIVSAAGLSPTWASSEDGLTHTCQVESYPDVIVITDSEGRIASISVSVSLTMLNMATMGNSFGEMMSYSSMTALMLTDSSFVNEIDAFTSSLITLLSDGMNNADSEPRSSSITAYGAEITFLTSALNEAAFSMDIAFRVTPADPNAAAEAVEPIVSAEPTDAAVPGEIAESALTFPMDAMTYQAMFDALLSSNGLTTVWASSEDGLVHTGLVEGYPDVVVVTDATGNIASISVSADLTMLNMATMGNNFGEMMSYTSMGALMLTDDSFLNDVDAFLNTLIGLLTDGLSKLGAEPVSSSITAYGAVFTFAVSPLDMASLSFSTAFSMTPAAAE